MSAATSVATAVSGPVLSLSEARSFYDRLGSRQDLQWFYEGAALEELIANGAFEDAMLVYELGCGTGSFADQLLSYFLLDGARYVGCDISTTMVGLARHRLARFGRRAEILLSDGAPRVDSPERSVDRFVSNYVFDLLAPETIRSLLNEAHRVLRPNGSLCLVSLTHGHGPISSLVSTAWSALQKRRPAWVGGCRPIELRQFLATDRWEIRHRAEVTRLGIPSEVIIARPRH